jgi:hypothetical protein
MGILLIIIILSQNLSPKREFAYKYDRQPFGMIGTVTLRDASLERDENLKGSSLRYVKTAWGGRWAGFQGSDRPAGDAVDAGASCAGSWLPYKMLNYKKLGYIISLEFYRFKRICKNLSNFQKFSIWDFPDVNAGKSGERFAFDISGKRDSLIYYKFGFSSASFPGSVSVVVPIFGNNHRCRACQWEGGWVFFVFFNSDLVRFPWCKLSLLRWLVYCASPAKGPWQCPNTYYLHVSSSDSPLGRSAGAALDVPQFCRSSVHEW